MQPWCCLRSGECKWRGSKFRVTAQPEMRSRSCFHWLSGGDVSVAAALSKPRPTPLPNRSVTLCLHTTLFPSPVNSNYASFFSLSHSHSSRVQPDARTVKSEWELSDRNRQLFKKHNITYNTSETSLQVHRNIAQVFWSNEDERKKWKEKERRKQQAVSLL